MQGRQHDNECPACRLLKAEAFLGGWLAQGPEQLPLLPPLLLGLFVVPS